MILAGARFVVREMPIGRLKEFWRRVDAITSDMLTTYRQQGKTMGDDDARELGSLHTLRLAYHDSDVELVAAALADQKAPDGQRVTRQWIEDHVTDPNELSLVADVVWDVNILGPKVTRRMEAIMRRLLLLAGTYTTASPTNTDGPPKSSTA